MFAVEQMRRPAADIERQILMRHRGSDPAETPAAWSAASKTPA